MAEKHKMELEIEIYNLRQKIRDSDYQSHMSIEIEKIASVGTWQLSMTTGTVSLSKGLAEILLIDFDSTLTWEAFKRIIHPDDINEFEDWIDRVMNESITSTLQHRIIDTEKQIKYVEHIAKTFNATTGIPLRTIGSIKDITKQKKVEIELKINEEKYREIVDSLIDVLIRSNSKGNIELVSSSVFEVLGYEKEGLIGEAIVNLFVNPESTKNHTEEVINAGQCHNFEQQMYSKNGEIKYMITNSKRYIDASGSYGIESIFRDITIYTEQKRAISENKKRFTKRLKQKVIERTIELKNSELKLKEALSIEKELSDMKSRFISTASHQFRTPLTIIQSNLGLLEMKTTTADSEVKRTIEQHSKIIGKEIKHMTDLMDDVLLLGKTNMKGTKPLYEKIDVVDCCKRVLNRYNLIIDYEITISVIGNIQLYYLDSKLFDHSVSNIVSNALKYSEGQPFPVLQISFLKDSLEVLIEDFGMGIPESEIVNVFVPFYRASNVITIQGTGLGMSIVKEYVELNRGVISIESVINVGTKVKMKYRLANG